jgi:ubiquinone/menaquinone biosynthesis C-methylase UbiE
MAEEPEWTGRRVVAHGTFHGSRIAGILEELAFGPGPSRVLRRAADVISGDETVLDVGCGPGTLSLPLAKLMQAGEIICLDLSPEMLARLETRARKAGLEARLRIVRAPAWESGLESRSVDLCVSNNVFHELDRPQEALAEQLRVLKPGGYMIFSDFRPTRLVGMVEKRHPPHPPPEVESMVREAGFADTELAVRRHRVLLSARRPIEED